MLYVFEEHAAIHGSGEELGNRCTVKPPEDTIVVALGVFSGRCLSHALFLWLGHTHGSNSC
jgi:hypothetical protein